MRYIVYLSNKERICCCYNLLVYSIYCKSFITVLGMGLTTPFLTFNVSHNISLTKQLLLEQQQFKQLSYISLFKPILQIEKQHSDVKKNE